MPALPLSFNSGVMSSPGIGVRDETERAKWVSSVKVRIMGRQSKVHYCRLKSSPFQNSIQCQGILVTETVTHTPSHNSIIFLLLSLSKFHHGSNTETTVRQTWLDNGMCGRGQNNTANRGLHKYYRRDNHYYILSREEQKQVWEKLRELYCFRNYTF